MQTFENLNVLTEDYDNIYRLPDTVIPIKYKLTLDPDIEEGTFTGNIMIEVEVKQFTQRIFLNSHQLKVTRAEVLTTMDDPIIFHPIETVYTQKKRQLLVISMEPPLNPGFYSILLCYNGMLNNESVGLYKTWNSSVDELPRYCVATYFEPTYARFAFPCFDEPHLKAKYLVSLVRPSCDDYVALSNSSVKLEVVDYPRQGVTTVHFNETQPISSYLTCFIVGVFQRLEPATALSGRLPVSVYAQPNLVEHTAFSRDLAAKILDFFSQYFQIDYPFPKLDLIAIPDSKLSGMENWGLITFRETALLLSPDESCTTDILTVVRVVVHELSHMWFGNLVTIAWWNDTWLKEGMADFMSYIGGSYGYPSWYQEWVFLNGQVLPALQKDCALSSHPVVLPVSHPDQIREMFDTISYLKGSCLIRMLHDIDSTKFRRGLMSYVALMKWSNATTSDLWQALSQSMGWPVGNIMAPWTEQAGYPLVTVSKQGRDYVVTQSRFLTHCSTTYDLSSSPYKYLWDIPIKYVTSKDKSKVESLWFYRDCDSATITVPAGVKWLKLNWHYIGFYRVNYSQTMWEHFSELLQHNVSEFDAEDRCSLINDAFCLASAGYIKYDIPLNLIMYVKGGHEDNFLVWSVIRGHLEKLQTLLTSSRSSQLFSKYLEMLLKPIIAKLNWDINESVPYMERKLRVELIDLACLFGFESVLDRIRQIYSDMIEKRKAKPNTEIRAIVHTYGLVGVAGEALWDKTRLLFIHEKNPREVINLLRSLASTNNPDLITRLLSESKNPDVVRSQDFFLLLRFISKTPTGNKIIWNFIRNEWSYLVSRFTLNDLNLGMTVNFVTSNFSSTEQLAEVVEFFMMNPEAGAGASERKHTLESIKANIRWNQENNDFLNNWFSKL